MTEVSKPHSDLLEEAKWLDDVLPLYSNQHMAQVWKLRQFVPGLLEQLEAKERLLDLASAMGHSLEEQLEVAERRERYEQERAEKWHGKYVDLVEQLEAVQRDRDGYLNAKVDLEEQLEALEGALREARNWIIEEPDTGDITDWRGRLLNRIDHALSNPANSPSVLDSSIDIEGAEAGWTGASDPKNPHG